MLHPRATIHVVYIKYVDLANVIQLAPDARMNIHPQECARKILARLVLGAKIFIRSWFVGLDRRLCFVVQL